MINIPIKPMLLHKSDAVLTGDFLHQLKWDGFRCLFHWDKGKVRLFTRNQNDCSLQFPEMKKVDFPAQNIIIDGEMIVLDQENKPCFESVMQRLRTKDELNIRRNMHAIPAHFVAYDVLYLDGEAVTHLPIEKRLSLLYEVVNFSPEISACESFEDGQALFKSVTEMGLEGIVSKRKGSMYRVDNRSHDWIKVKNYQYEVVNITGIRKKEFAWSISKDGQYVGTCEFVPPNERNAFFEIAKQITVREDKDWVYLEPVIKCKVKFQAYTKKGLLRTPSFVEFVY